MFELLLVLLLGLHLICVNIASAGPLVCHFLARRERFGEQQAGQIGRRMAWLCLAARVVGAALGLLQGWLQWRFDPTGLVDVLPNFGHKIYWGILELATSAAGLIIYGLWWQAARTAAWERVTHALVAWFVSTNLLYHFPVLFAVMTRAAVDPESVPAQVDPAAFRRLAFSPEILAQATHFGLASVAVSCVVLMLFATRRNVTALARSGARIALAATLMQLPVGLWLVSALPPSGQHAVIGGNLAASVLLGASVLGSFWLLNELAAASFSEPTSARCYRVALIVLAIVMMMSGVLRTSRAPIRPMSGEVVTTNRPLSADAIDAGP